MPSFDLYSLCAPPARHSLCAPPARHSFCAPPARRIVQIALCLAVSLAGATAGSEGPSCAGIDVRSGAMIFGDGFESGDLSAWQGSEPSFQATRMLDLDLVVRLAAGFSGNHVLHVKLSTPKGHHYQTLTAPIASAAAHAGATRRVEGFPRPLPVQVARAARGPAGETSVVQQLPVAGTPIVSSGLYGKWTASAFLDDATEPCGDSSSFFITP